MWPERGPDLVISLVCHGETMEKHPSRKGKGLAICGTALGGVVPQWEV